MLILVLNESSCFFANQIRPDITIMVGWALKINYLSYYLSIANQKILVCLLIVEQLVLHIIHHRHGQGAWFDKPDQQIAYQGMESPSQKMNLRLLCLHGYKNA